MSNDTLSNGTPIFLEKIGRRVLWTVIFMGCTGAREETGLTINQRSNVGLPHSSNLGLPPPHSSNVGLPPHSLAENEILFMTRIQVL